MDIFISSLNVVIPFVVLLALGFVARKRKLITPEGISSMNSLIYNILLPAMLIINIFESTDVGEGFVGLFVYMVIWLVAITVTAALIVPRLIKKESVSAFTASIIRGNYAIYGLPLAQSVLPAEVVPDFVSLLVPGILVSNILTLIICELWADNKKKFSLFKFLKKVFSAPIVCAVIIALILKYSGIILPEFLTTSLSFLSGATTPIAFLCLGASFTFMSVKNNIKLISTATIIKLVILPALILIPAVFYFGFSNIQIVVLICIFATPTAATGSAMVKELNGDFKLIGEITMFTAIFSIITIFLIVYGLRLIEVL